MTFVLGVNVHTAFDQRRNISATVVFGRDYEQWLEFRMHGLPAFIFEIEIVLQDENEWVDGTPASVKLSVSAIMAELRLKGLDQPFLVDANTAILRNVVSAICAINRKWPLSRSPFLYSDYEQRVKNGEEFNFRLYHNRALHDMSS